MRISIDMNDKAYDAKSHFARVGVFVDGKQVKCPVTADTEEGYVKCFDMGPLMGGPDIEMHGKVEIREVKWRTKMVYEDLLEQAKDAADELFRDQSVSRETTKASLEDLHGHIEIMLDSM